MLITLALIFESCAWGLGGGKALVALPYSTTQVEKTKACAVFGVLC